MHKYFTDSITENKCGFEEIMPEAEPLEIRPSPTLPTNITLIGTNVPNLTSQRIIFAVIGSILALILILLLIVCSRNFTFKRGDYDTREAKGVKDTDAVDLAVMSEQTGQPEVGNKEWWL